MISRFFAILIFSFVLSYAGTLVAAPSCQSMFQETASLDKYVGHEGRRTFAGLVEQAGVADSSYVVQWKLKPTSNPGPYPTAGEFIVSSVSKDKVSAWIQGVGKNTIGFGVEGFPSRKNFNSAVLRVGHRLYFYGTIQHGGSFHDLSVAPPTFGYTEASFFVTDAEMTAIIKFIEDRVSHRILAKEKIPGGPDVGVAIMPDFNFYQSTLTQESCAGACSSFISPLWLKHYEGARVLQQIADRLRLESNPAAKAMVWRQARKENMMAITMIGTMPKETENLIPKHKWGQLKGIPVYSMIPDPLGGENNQVVSTRTPIAEWLRGNESGN